MLTPFGPGQNHVALVGPEIPDRGDTTLSRAVSAAEALRQQSSALFFARLAEDEETSLNWMEQTENHPLRRALFALEDEAVQQYELKEELLDALVAKL